jgi:magnesium-transporting ATPase (P-type)
VQIIAALALVIERPRKAAMKRGPDESLITKDMAKNIARQGIYQLFWVGFIVCGMKHFKDSIFNEIYLEPKKCYNAEGYSIEENGAYRSYEQCKEGVDFPMTLCFQTFVMMQLFNMINCRNMRLSELNVFAGIFNNLRFLFSFFVIFVVQTGIVQFGDAFFQTSALTWQQHAFAVAVGFGALVFGVLLRLVPDRAFDCLNFM